MLSRDELDKLLLYGISLCGQRADAYDLLQASLEAALNQVSEIQYPMAYVRRTMRNRYIDALRHDQRYKFFEIDEHVMNVPSSEDTLEDILLDELTLQAFWQQLKPAEREVLYYSAVDGMTASEIALHLALPLSTILSRLHRIRKRFDNKNLQSKA